MFPEVLPLSGTTCVIAGAPPLSQFPTLWRKTVSRPLNLSHIDMVTAVYLILWEVNNGQPPTRCVSVFLNMKRSFDITEERHAPKDPVFWTK